MLPLVLLSALGAPPAVASAEPDAALDALFRPQTGWVGGDGAFSVVLPNGRALWLFSDTFVGSVRDGKRRDVTMVNNTVGAQDGRGERTKLEFFVAREKDKPRALFVPPDDAKSWFWIFAGHSANDQLHVFLPRFEKADAPSATRPPNRPSGRRPTRRCRSRSSARSGRCRSVRRC
jgi:hypothetical protein